MSPILSAASGVSAGIGCVIAATWVDAAVKIARVFGEEADLGVVYALVAVGAAALVAGLGYAGWALRRARAEVSAFASGFAATVFGLVSIALILGVMINGLSALWFVGVAVASLSLAAGFALTQAR